MKRFLKRNGIIVIISMILGLTTFQGCKKTEVTPQPTEVENPLTESVYYISGVVKSSGSALSGVTVSTGNITTTTDTDGSYELSVESTATATVSFSKNGYIGVEASAIFATGASSGAIVSLSQDMTAQVATQTASSTKDTELSFNNADDTEAENTVVIAIPAAALTEDTEISATQIVPAPDVATAVAVTAAEEKEEETTVAVTSTFSALYLTPEGQIFTDSITVSIPATVGSYFTDVKHVKLVDGVWEDQGDATYNVESATYDITMIGFSQHGVTADCDVTVKKGTSEVLASKTIDNIGSTNSVSDVVTYSQKSGWEIASSEGVSEELYSQMLSYIAGVFGTSESVSSVSKSRDVAVSGDENMVITVTQSVADYSFTFVTNNGSETIHVNSYGAVSTDIVTTQGDLRTDHND